MREPHLIECLREYVHECARVHARVHECVRRQQYMHPKITRKASQKTSKTSNVRPRLKQEKAHIKIMLISDSLEQAGIHCDVPRTRYAMKPDVRLRLEKPFLAKLDGQEHDMTLFVHKVIPDVVDQRCAYISVVAPICCLTFRCAVACKTTTHAT